MTVICDILMNDLFDTFRDVKKKLFKWSEWQRETRAIYAAESMSSFDDL